MRAKPNLGMTAKHDDHEITSQKQGRAKGDGFKVTEPNLPFPAVFCKNLRFSAKICTLGMHEFPGEGVNLRESAVFAKICVLGSLCHLRLRRFMAVFVSSVCRKSLKKSFIP